MSHTEMDFILAAVSLFHPNLAEPQHNLTSEVGGGAEGYPGNV